MISLQALRQFRGRRRAWREKSRRVAVTLPEFSFCFNYSQSGGRAPPFQLHPGAAPCQRLENAVSTSVFSSSSLQEWPQTMQFRWFSVAVRLQKWSKNDQKPEKILSERIFSAFGGFKMAQNNGIYTGLCTFPAQNPGSCDGFALCHHPRSDGLHPRNHKN